MNRELIKDFLRESFPNPERRGCPEEDVLQALAEDRIAPDDPSLLHIGSCSECYREYLHLRREIEELRAGDRPGEQIASSQDDSRVLLFPRRSKGSTSSDLDK